MTEEEITHCEFWVTANRKVRESGVPNCKGERIQVNFDWDLDLMSKWLKDYEDRDLIDYLKFGWPLNAKNTSENQEIPRNQKGAVEHGEQVREYLKKERESGTLIGPFLKNPFGKAARFSPIDAINKKDSEEKRIILNLSHPFEGNSVNASIDTEAYANEENMKTRFPSIDDLVKIIRKKGKRGAHFH